MFSLVLKKDKIEAERLDSNIIALITITIIIIIIIIIMLS